MEINTILFVKELIKKGAEANIYTGRFVGIDIIIKNRISKKYRHKFIDQRIRFLRTRNEARVLLTASDIGINTPKLIGCNISEYTLILERIDGENVGTLLINSTDSNKDKEKTLYRKIVNSFRRIGEQVALMHNSGIIHGDLTPFNVILKEKPYLLDFGLSSIDHSNIEKMATDILTFEAILLAISYSEAEELFDEFLVGYFEKSHISKTVMSSKMEKISVRGRYVPRKIRKKHYS